MSGNRKFTLIGDAMPSTKEPIVPTIKELPVNNKSENSDKAALPTNNKIIENNIQ